MQRISIIGSCGSGKTTFARKLAAKLDVPHIEMDALFWLPNWQPKPIEEFRNSVTAAVADEAWVIDGNYSQGRLRDIYLARATTVVWLNYSYPVTLGRLLKRTLRRISRHETLYGNNQETARMAFCSRDSILWWMTKNYRRRRREYRKLFNDEQYAHLQRIEIRRPREAEALLEQSGLLSTELEMGC